MLISLPLGTYMDSSERCRARQQAVGAKGDVHGDFGCHGREHLVHQMVVSKTEWRAKGIASFK